jgi:hypothetical protein
VGRATRHTGGGQECESFQKKPSVQKYQRVAWDAALRVPAWTNDGIPARYRTKEFTAVFADNYRSGRMAEKDSLGESAGRHGLQR